MPQIMVEAFARSLVDKIMLEAFGVVDANDEKVHMLDNRGETSDIQSQSIHSALETHDRSCTGPNEFETTEIIGKMVRGLRNVQIGDSISVPSRLSALEKQVKHVVHNIGSVSFTDTAKTADTQITQGQGDVQKVIHDAVIETPDSTCSRKEKDNCGYNEATRVSISLLHRMIEELETKIEKLDVGRDNKSDSVSKEGTATWEETEEQFIRTKEYVEDTDQNNTAFPPVSNSSNHVCDSTHDRLASSSPVHPKNYTNEYVSLEEAAVEEITSLPVQKDKPSSMSGENRNSLVDEMKSGEQKKRSVLGRMRKMLRTVFGRRKN